MSRPFDASSSRDCSPLRVLAPRTSTTDRFTVRALSATSDLYSLAVRALGAGVAVAPPEALEPPPLEELEPHPATTIGTANTRRVREARIG